MVNRKGFFGIGLAMLASCVSALAASSPPRLLHSRKLAKGEMLTAAPLLGGVDVVGEDSLVSASGAVRCAEHPGWRTLCKAVICASSSGMNPPLSGRNLHWHGPLSGYAAFGHEFAEHYEQTGIFDMFGLEEIPPVDSSNRCFILGAAAHMALKPACKSYWKQYAGQDYHTICAADVVSGKQTLGGS